jgi:pimeloyl-ACP methyl ester carboxylesterase
MNESPAILDQTFTHEGRTLVFDEFGSGDEVVLYLHGLLLDSEINRGIAQALADQGQRVLLLDLLGHGRSDKPQHASEYRMDRYAEQAIALLDHLHVPAAVLGGVSLGANVSLIAASTHPTRVRGLILEMPVLEWAVPAAAILFSPMLLAAHYGRRVMRVASDLFARIPPTGFGPLNSVIRSAALPPEVVASVLHGILVGPIAPTIDERRAIQAPTLILAHGNDLIHPFDDAVNLSNQLPHASLMRTHGQLELRLMPTRLTNEIADFVDGIWHPAAAAA